jgi:tight adherence protein B
VTGTWWVLPICLVTGALAAAWPSGGAGDRLLPRPRRELSLPRLDLGLARQQLEAHPRRSVAVLALTVAVVALLVSGVVAGLLGAVYGALAARALVRRSVRRRVGALREQSLDELGALAADLRAGLPPVEAGSARGRALGASPAAGGAAERRTAELTAAVWRLAERTGAPAAELVDRIEADARTADRAHALAAAQAAGAQATAVILTGLPVGGILLGYGIGVAPLPILLHTMLGGACALGAALLQTLGLLWAGRLTSGPAR